MFVATGVEVAYDMYSPFLLKIECLKLEKRLDDNLAYLRDAPPEYSTVSQDFRRVVHPPGAPVPVNKTIVSVALHLRQPPSIYLLIIFLQNSFKVKMNPYPWFARWELKKYKGMDYSHSDLPPKYLKGVTHPQNVRAWEKHDLMRQYRNSIDDESTEQIMSEVRLGVKANRARARKQMEIEERQKLQQ